MSEKVKSTDPNEVVEVDLKDPFWAGVLAWLWPGAGHLYQGRHAKGILFMVCILSTFIFGLIIGGGHVVYASWTPADKRLPYLCQIGIGLPAMPALVQGYLVTVAHKPPLLGDEDGNALMAPPPQPVIPGGPDALAQWHAKAGYLFEMGTLYTMVAGLLNILAIYDAAAGPVFTVPQKKRGADKSRSTDESPPKDKNDE